MDTIQLLILAVSLSMDAFAVAICKGLAFGRIRLRQALVVGLYFGVFQAAMPTIGYFLGMGFRQYIESFDHWIAFGLLAFLGARMIIEAVRGGEEEVSSSLDIREMTLLAIATSIDALAAGISLSVLDASIGTAALFIGIITFTLSVVAVYIGGYIGAKFKKPAELAGGAALVLLGIKVLIDHLG